MARLIICSLCSGSRVHCEDGENIIRCPSCNGRGSREQHKIPLIPFPDKKLTDQEISEAFDFLREIGF